jgi:hypothetical protein
MMAYSTDPNKGQAPFIAQPIDTLYEKNNQVCFHLYFVIHFMGCHCSYWHTKWVVAPTDE